MRIRITGRGIYGGDGEVAVGTELTVNGKIPDGWKGRYEIIKGEPNPETTPITNPAEDDDRPRRRGRPAKGDE